MRPVDPLDEDESLLPSGGDWPESFCDPPDSAALMESIRGETSRVLGVRRRRRIGMIAGAWVAVYCLGLATAAGLSTWLEDESLPSTTMVRSPSAGIEKERTSEDDDITLIDESSPRLDLPVVVKVELTDEQKADMARTVNLESKDPDLLEKLARRGSLKSQIRLLQRAGDLYLSRNDVEGALRTYQRLISLLPRTRRSQVNPSDTWLLAALKLE